MIRFASFTVAALMLSASTAYAGYGHSSHRCQRVWVPAKYKVVQRDVVVPAKYDFIQERVWIEPVYEYRTRKIWVPKKKSKGLKLNINTGPVDLRLNLGKRKKHGYYRTVTEKVLVRKGYYKTVSRRVCVSKQYVRVVEQRICVRAGYYKTVCSSSCRHTSGSVGVLSRY